MGAVLPIAKLEVVELRVAPGVSVFSNAPSK
jgi:hypothetical protein